VKCDEQFFKGGENKMNYQTQWMETVLNTTRNSFENSMKTMESLSQQTKKMLEMTMNNAELVQAETKKLFDSLYSNYKGMNKACSQAMEEGLKTVEQQFSFLGPK
jgi:collagenase-like PrtC family protease